MKSISRWLAPLCVAALLSAPPPARAAGAEDDSRTLFAQGRSLRLSGKCEEAIIAFRRALELYPTGLGALRNVAECEEELGLLAAARRDWWDLRRAAMQSNEARYAGWVADAEQRYRALEPRVARLTVKLQGGDAGKVRLTLDGVPLDTRLLGVELERDAGAHVVEAFHGGADPISERVTLAEGARETVTLVLPAISAPPPDRGRPAPAAARPVGPFGPGARTAGYVALGVGAASAVATAISIGVRQGALGALAEDCPRYRTEPCPSSVEGARDTGQTASALVNVFGAVAIAGAGAGAILVITSPSAGAAAPAPPGRTGSPSAALTLSPTLGGAAAQWHMRF